MLAHVRFHYPFEVLLRRAVLLGVVALVLACSSEDPRPELESRPVSAATVAACRESGVAVCARLRSCAAQLLLTFYGSIETCERNTAAACEVKYSGPGSAQAPASCASSVAALACEELFELYGSSVTIHGCAVTPGAFPEDAKCLSDGDCASGACSRFVDCTHTPCTFPCGTCLGPPAGEGESCVLPGRCAPGLVCFAPVFNGPPVRGTCVRPRRLGESCDDERPCSGGSIFTTCAPKPGSVSTTDRVCVERGGPDTGGLGGGCNGVDCAIAQGLGCDLNRVCSSVVLSPVGGVCDDLPLVGRSGRFACDGTGRCANHVCVRAAALGEPCTSTTTGSTCAGGAVCDDVTLRCTMHATRSDSCSGKIFE